MEITTLEDLPAGTLLLGTMGRMGLYDYTNKTLLLIGEGTNKSNHLMLTNTKDYYAFTSKLREKESQGVSLEEYIDYILPENVIDYIIERNEFIFGEVSIEKIISSARRDIELMQNAVKNFSMSLNLEEDGSSKETEPNFMVNLAVILPNVDNEDKQHYLNVTKSPDYFTCTRIDNSTGIYLSDSMDLSNIYGWASKTVFTVSEYNQLRHKLSMVGGSLLGKPELPKYCPYSPVFEFVKK